MTTLAIIRSAVLSPCGLYRYRLSRMWNIELPALLFIMLNPSKADAYTDDATIRICFGRAIRMGCGSIVVINLFAYRATNPADMLVISDPIGPENDYHVERALLSQPKQVIAAWGVGGNFMNRARKMSDKCHAFGIQMHCLGVTKDGAPKHPLRIAYAVEPQVWKAAE